MERSWTRPVSVGAVSAVVGVTSSFAVVLAGLTAAGADPAQAASGLVVLTALMGVATIWLSRRFRRPLTVAWSTPGAALLASTGAAAVGFDATRPAFTGSTALPAALDAIGETWDAGVPLFLGLLPSTAPAREPEIGDLARRGYELADRLGFARERLARLAVPTPACGLAGATPEWSRRALALSRELGRAFADPDEVPPEA